MKKLTTIYLCIVLSFLSCKQKVELMDGYYFANAKNEIYDDIIRLSKFHKNDFEKLSPFTEEKSIKMNELLSNGIYHSETDLGTCLVNGCLVQIKNKQIIKVIYLTCNSVQLLIFEDERFQNSILLNDSGIAEIERILE